MEEKISKVEEQNMTARQILSMCINSPNRIDDFSKLGIYDFPEELREIFLFLIGLNKDERKDITYKALKKGDKFYHKFVDLLANHYEVYFTPDYLFKKLKDLSESIKIETTLKKYLVTAKNNLQGIDLLFQLEDELKAEIKELGERFKDESSISEKLPEMIKRYEENSNYKESCFFSKNFPSFNKLTGGIRLGNFIGIAGAWKNGKTTIGINLILDFAKQNIPCALFSFEMTVSECEDKINSQLLSIEYNKLRNPSNLNLEEISKLNSFYLKNKIPLYISKGHYTEYQIKSKIKEYKDRYGVKIFLIDYLTHIQSEMKFNSLSERMNFHSALFKQIAIEFNVIIIMIAQLNREGIKDSRNGNKPPSYLNLADAIGLARDVDYGFIIFSPLMYGIKDHKAIEMTEDHFILKLDVSRHTKQGGAILLRKNSYDQFREQSTEIYSPAMEVF